jgi:membrane dipeptidase
MLRRNWTNDEVKDLMGRNLLRVMDEVDAVSERLREELPSLEVHSARKDLPARWGGLGDTYFPHEVRAEQRKLFQHDEL